MTEPRDGRGRPAGNRTATNSQQSGRATAAVERTTCTPLITTAAAGVDAVHTGRRLVATPASTIAPRPTPVPGVTVKTYRRHYCTRRHRNHSTFARCVWRRAAWVLGDGPYATVARCRALTVQLHPTPEAAWTALRIMRPPSGCGGVCYGNHLFVELVLP